MPAFRAMARFEMTTGSGVLQTGVAGQRDLVEIRTTLSPYSNFVPATAANDSGSTLVAPTVRPFQHC